jgi:hypothetical protein
MGVNIAILGLSGVVIASDTMENTEHSNVRYDSLIKILPFGAAAEYGLYYSISRKNLGVPIETLIEDINAKLLQSKKVFSNTIDAGKFLINHYQSSIDYYQINHNILAELYETFFYTVVEEELEPSTYAINERELKDILTKISLHKKEEAPNPYLLRLDLYYSKMELKNLRTKYRKYILDKLNLTHTTKVFDLIFDAMSHSDIYVDKSTINIAGYRDASPFPELYILRIFGIVDGRVLYNDELIKTDYEDPTRVVFDGETSYIDRFIGGVDFSILSEFNTFYVKSLIKYLDMSEQDFSSQIEYLEELIPKLEEEFHLADITYMFQNEKDFMEFLSYLPHQEIKRIAYELVRMTILLSQFDFSGSQRAGKTGGDITVATLKKHQPFMYVAKENI